MQCGEWVRNLVRPLSKFDYAFEESDFLYDK